MKRAKGYAYALRKTELSLKKIYPLLELDEDKVKAIVALDPFFVVMIYTSLNKELATIKNIENASKLVGEMETVFEEYFPGYVLEKNMILWRYANLKQENPDDLKKIIKIYPRYLELDCLLFETEKKIISEHWQIEPNSRFSASSDNLYESFLLHIEKKNCPLGNGCSSLHGKKMQFIDAALDIMGTPVINNPAWNLEELQLTQRIKSLINEIEDIVNKTEDYKEELMDAGKETAQAST